MPRPGGARWLIGIGGTVIAAALLGCGERRQAPSAAEGAAALAAILGPLSADLEVLFYEPRGGDAAAWIIRSPGRWRPHEAAEHRHVTLPADTFQNLAAALAQGTIDPGAPAEASCRYTEWRTEAAGTGRPRDVRIYQLMTARGEITVLETLPDPAGG